MQPTPITSKAARPTGLRTSSSVHGRQATTSMASATTPITRSSSTE